MAAHAVTSTEADAETTGARAATQETTAMAAHAVISAGVAAETTEARADTQGMTATAAHAVTSAEADVATTGARVDTQGTTATAARAVTSAEADAATTGARVDTPGTTAMAAHVATSAGVDAAMIEARADMPGMTVATVDHTVVFKEVDMEIAWRTADSVTDNATMDLAEVDKAPACNIAGSAGEIVRIHGSIAGLTGDSASGVKTALREIRWSISTRC